MFISTYSTSAPIPKIPQLFFKDTLLIKWITYWNLAITIIHFGYASSYSDMHFLPTPGDFFSTKITFNNLGQTSSYRAFLLKKAWFYGVFLVFNISLKHHLWASRSTRFSLYCTLLFTKSSIQNQFLHIFSAQTFTLYCWFWFPQPPGRMLKSVKKEQFLFILHISLFILCLSKTCSNDPVSLYIAVFSGHHSPFLRH